MYVFIGLDLFTAVPSPNWPEALPPQVQIEPVESIAVECDAPADTLVAVEVNVFVLPPEPIKEYDKTTATGDDLFMVVPSPIWPVEFKPHAHIVLS